MKILISTVLIFNIGILKSSSQDYFKYYETINLAEIAHLDQNYDSADSYYTTAFNLVDKPFKDDCLLAALNSEKLNNNQKTYDYLKKGILLGLTLKRIKKEFSKFKKSDQFKKLKEEYSIKRENYLKALDLDLRTTLLDMVKKDQSARQLLGSAKKRKATDASNYIRLIEIIENNDGKWPGRFLIGDGNDNGKYSHGEVTIMLHHFKKGQVNNLIPVLVNAIKRGDLSPYNVAYALDYKNLKQIEERKRGKTTFTYSCNLIGSYKPSNKKEIFICDCEYAENKRKLMGLESLDDYFRKINLPYNCYK